MPLSFEAAQHPALHPGRSARVLLDGVEIGVVGELHGTYKGVLSGLGPNLPFGKGSAETMKIVPQQPFRVTAIRAAFAKGTGPVKLRLQRAWGRSYPGLWPKSKDESLDVIPPMVVEVTEASEEMQEFPLPGDGALLLPTQHYMITYEHLAQEPGLAIESVPKGEYSRALAFMAKQADAVAKDLVANKGKGAVLAGDRQPAAVHAIAAALNSLLGNIGEGKPVSYSQSVLIDSAVGVGSLKALVDEINAGKVDTLITNIYDPSYARFADVDAAKAIGLVLPELNGKLDGYAIRVPTINVSIVDLTFVAARETTKDEVNAIIKEAAEGPLKGILGYNTEALVSTDFNHTTTSSNFDATQTQVIGNLVKVLSWYDNEWGFSNRMSDTAVAMGKLV